ncbi:MAG: hypothetical protein HYY50_01500 [Candidatus Kerfeldbacteria bacterium]|nr:hypothetical protein [Candidatus Kerfeldbacteria bacterium]
MFLDYRIRLPFLLVMVITIAALASPARSQNFINPGADAPSGSIAPPLNAGNTIQRKIGPLLIGPDPRIAYYECYSYGGASELETWLGTAIQSDPWLSARTSYYSDIDNTDPYDDGCLDSLEPGDPQPRRLRQMLLDNAAHPFSLIILNTPGLANGVPDPSDNYLAQIEDYIADGGTVLVTRKPVGLDGDPKVGPGDISRQLFAGVVMCKSYCEDPTWTGCGYTMQGGAAGCDSNPVNRPSGPFTASVSSPWDISPAAAGGDDVSWQYPPTARYMGVIGNSTGYNDHGVGSTVHGSINPTLDVVYNLSSAPADVGPIGQMAHWQYFQGKVYFVADESENLSIVDNGTEDENSICGSDDTMCIKTTGAPGGDYDRTVRFWINTITTLAEQCGDRCQSKICLNADVGADINDPVNCISQWTDVVISGGPYVSLTESRVTGDPLSISSYSLQTGFARVRSTGSGQAFSTIVHSSAAGPEAAALDSTDGSTAGNEAGLFGGRFWVHSNLVDDLGQLCLNGTGAVDCITSWDQVDTLFTSSYVKLQAYAIGQPVLSTAQEEQIGGGSVSGVGKISTIIAGNPANVSGVSCGAAPCTCGDGQCADPAETGGVGGNCPADCDAISPAVSLSLGTWLETVTLRVRTAAQAPAGSKVKLLVVRRQGAAPDFVPQAGVVYATNMVFGSNKIVYAGEVDQDTLVTVPADSDPALDADQTYFYQAIQGNLFPRYGTPVTESITLRQLFVSKNIPGAGSIFGSAFNCLPACFGASAFYRHGTVETIRATASAPNEFIGWEGSDCFGPDPECTITMDRTRSARAIYCEPPRPGRICAE